MSPKTVQTRFNDTVDQPDQWRHTWPTSESDVKVADLPSRVRRQDWGVCYGWNTPNFHERKRRGDLIPMTRWHQSEFSGSMSGILDVTTVDTNANPDQYARWYSKDGVWSYTTDWALNHDILAPHIPERYDQYLQEAAAKIYGNGHDTLTFLAELADVKRMFAGIAKRMLRLNFNPKTIKDVTSAWLSMRYGWRPLIYDIASLNEALKSLNAKRTRYSERAGNSFSYTESSDVTVSDSVYEVICHFEDTIEIGIRGSVVADIEVPAFQFNPLQTGWEIIPFSFVIDWFVNVGKTLAAWTFLSLQMDYTAAKGFKVTMTREYSTSIGNTWGAYYNSATTASGTSTATMTVRTPSKIPLLPRLNLRLNSFKILDLLGLVVQKFARR